METKNADSLVLEMLIASGQVRDPQVAKARGIVNLIVELAAMPVAEAQTRPIVPAEYAEKALAEIKARNFDLIQLAIGALVELANAKAGLSVHRRMTLANNALKALQSISL